MQYNISTLPLPYDLETKEILKHMSMKMAFGGHIKDVMSMKVAFCGHEGVKVKKHITLWQRN